MLSWVLRPKFAENQKKEKGFGFKKVVESISHKSHLICKTKVVEKTDRWKLTLDADCTSDKERELRGGQRWPW